MVLDILVKIQLSTLERYLARCQYRTFVIDLSISEEGPNQYVLPSNKQPTNPGHFKLNVF